MGERYPIIEWDGDGYPTDESVAALRAFLPSLDECRALPDSHPVKRKERAMDVMALIRSLPEQMEGCVYARAWLKDAEGYAVMDRPIEIHFATGGWSGAEEIIEIIWGSWEAHLFAKRWERGGKYVFEIIDMEAPAQGGATDA